MDSEADVGASSAWAPRSSPLAEQLTDTLSALLDDQLQRWEMDNTEMDNQLQHQEAAVAKLVQDVEGALTDEGRMRRSFIDRLGEAEQYVASRRVGPLRMDELYEDLEHIGARVDNDFDSLVHAHEHAMSDDVFMHFASAGEKCGEVRAKLMQQTQQRFRKMRLSPLQLFRKLDSDRECTRDPPLLVFGAAFSHRWLANEFRRRHDL